MNRKKPLGIYVHIPFCVKKCYYCDFLSESSDDMIKHNYVEAVIKEIDSYKHLMEEYEVGSIFFGGGTPSILEENLLMKLLQKIQTVFGLSKDDNLEITVECNPGTLSKKKLETYFKSGVNRLSIGLQSANNEELKRLGRIHTYQEFEEGYFFAREAGFKNISVDLMSALPGQTLDSFQHTINKVTALSPEHLSVYSLIIEEGTPFHKIYLEEDTSICNVSVKYPLPSEEEDRAMYAWAGSYLEEQGYKRYEISNYAKTGYESKHNTFYWIRTEYIGLGLGASSFYKGNRYCNEENLSTYLEHSDKPDKLHKEFEEITRTAAIEEFMFLGLRMCKGISKEEFYKEFHIPIEEIYGNLIIRMKQAGCMREDKGRLSLTLHGLDVSNIVMSEFLLTQRLKV